MAKKVRGSRPDFIISDEAVSGEAVARVNQAIDMTEGRVRNAVKRLLISWSADEIVRADYLRRAATVASVTVHPPVAYALAAKSPDSIAATIAVTSIGAQYGGRIPLFALAPALGPWDSLVEELGTQNGRRFR